MCQSRMTPAHVPGRWVRAVAFLAASASMHVLAQDPAAADGAAERAFTVEAMTKIAEPVLDALSKNELKARMPVHEWEAERAAFTHFEAFARTLAGIAPWLELGPDTTVEGQERERFIALARQALINATDPAAPDYMNFTDSEGDQPLVEHAYLSAALLTAPNQLWQPLTNEQRLNVVNALKAGREIENTHNNNWILFPAMLEAALWTFTGDARVDRIEVAVNTFEDDWYLGDGTYSDGPEFNWDYYNSYVIHPFLLQVLRVAEQKGDPLAQSLEMALPRAQRYAEIVERLISPEGTIPIMGRSSAYRFAAFYHPAYMALTHSLPAEVDPAALRSGMTAVVRRMYEAPGTFDAAGWLNLGAVGSQPSIRNKYNATGSLYVALTGLVHLGLPATDPFWLAPPGRWTQQRIWAGEDVPRDVALEDRPKSDEGEDQGTR